jgi:hypothetical protein
MTDHTAIDAATRRLQLALDGLDAALSRRLEAGARDATLADQMHTIDADRARLAAELDVVTARARQLEATNRDIAGRIDGAIETIRAVLAAEES